MMYHVIEVNSKHGTISILSSHDKNSEAIKAKTTRRSRSLKETVLPGLLSSILTEMLCLPVGKMTKKSNAVIKYHIVGYADGWFGLWGSHDKKVNSNKSLKQKQTAYKSKGYKFKQYSDISYDDMRKKVCIMNIKKRGLPYGPKAFMKFHVLTKTNGMLVLLGSYGTKEHAETFGMKYFKHKGESPLKLVEGLDRKAILKRINKKNVLAKENSSKTKR